MDAGDRRRWQSQVTPEEFAVSMAAGFKKALPLNYAVGS
jgi:hypothetical protein